MRWCSCSPRTLSVGNFVNRGSNRTGDDCRGSDDYFRVVVVSGNDARGFVERVGSLLSVGTMGVAAPSALAVQTGG